MARIVTIDFETYFNSVNGYSLRNMNPTEYITDDRFTPQLLSVRVNQEDTKVYAYDEIGDALQGLGLEDPDTVTVGHNINGFDGLVLAQHFGIHPANIHDTMVMARYVGLSMVQSESHAALTETLDHGFKENGTAVSDGKRFREDFYNFEWDFFKQYCHDDTLQCSQNYFSLLPHVSQDALDFCSITAKMATNPCLSVDTEKLESFIAAANQKTQQAMQRLSHLFAFKNEAEFLKALRSGPKFAEMLMQLGVEPPKKFSSKKSQQEYARRRANGESVAFADCAVEGFAFSKKDQGFLDLLEHKNTDVVALVKAKLELNAGGVKRRAEKLLAAGRNGRKIPVMLRAFGAHTGRYTAGISEAETDGLNFQNFPKRDKEMLEIRKCIVAPEGHVLLSCDSSQIEARTLAYIANEQWLVEAFRQGRDPYSEMAESIFHVPAEEIRSKKDTDPTMKMYRNTGKIAILSAGYGVGKAKFADMLWQQGAKLAEDRQRHDQMAANSLNIYRKKNSRIVNMWHMMDRALLQMAAGKSFTWGGQNNNFFEFGLQHMIGLVSPIPSVVLPSGFTLRYPELRREKDHYTRNWGFVYEQWDRNYFTTKKIYGGLLTENIIQALAFQLLQWQALEMARAGLELKCNIHDAFLVCVPEDRASEAKEVMLTCMSRVPSTL